jgi:apolipoprotein N-acyltransferase
MADTDDKQVPLVVDLDGTLIRTDMMWESLARLLRKNPLTLFFILLWWSRGRAYLKSQLAKRVQIDPATLPYHEKFLTYLHQQKSTGRELILATASDLKMAEPIASYVGVFDEVLGSNGKINLRSENKLKALTDKFGPRGFDYAGNSSADFVVWRGAREAVVVNASHRVRHKAANCTKLGPVFCENFSHIAIARRVVTELLWRSGYLVAIAAGLLLASAFPGWNIAGFAWIAPAIILLAAQGRRGADAARIGYVAGLVFWLASLNWLLCIPATGLPILGWLALSAFLALYSALWVWLMAGTLEECHSWTERTLWALGGAAAWVTTEFTRSHFLTGFPWNLLGASQFEQIPLIQIAATTGVWGVSFVVAWFSLTVFSAGRRIIQYPANRYVWQSEIVLPLIGIVLLYVYGMIQQDTLTESKDSLRIALIQPNIPQTAIWSESEDKRRFGHLLTQTQAALTNPVDLVVWPESAVPAVNDETYATIIKFARTNHVWIILNAEDDDLTNSYNAAFVIDSSGRWLQVYHKRKLVIFGEYIPLIHWLPFVKYFTTITGAWSAGTEPAYFSITPDSEDSTSDSDSPRITVAGSPDSLPRRNIVAFPLICYEDSFPELARNAPGNDLDFLVNLTNDGWFGTRSEQWQHAADSVFRAIENRVPLLRCANNGVTCWIDASGRIRELLADKTGNVHPAGALIFDLPLPAPSDKNQPTFYQRHGDWFAWSCVGISALQLLRFKKQLSAYKPAPL